jgi:hypothetical protein
MRKLAENERDVLHKTLASRDAEIEKLQSDLRGYNAMMADRHRILEENFKMKEALQKLKCVSSENNWVKRLIEEVLG